jgi:hypothetical protein
MFPDRKQASRRFKAGLDELAGTRTFRIGIAALLCFLHLAMFARAGHERLDMPFNSAPGEAPFFSNPDAPATRGYPRQPHRWSRLVVSRLDAQHYIGTSVRGLTACPTDPSSPDLAYLDCGLGWLPAWGFTGSAVSRITGLPDDVSLVVLSVIAAILLNLLWVSATMFKRMGKVESYAILVAFNVFPAAFYVVTPYTEAATLACAIGGFIALANERWLLAGLLVGASTALRVSAVAFGIALGCALLVAAWQRRQAGTRAWWRPLVAIPLCGWGQAMTMLILQISLGDGRAFLRARDAFGDQHDFSRVFDGAYYVKGFAGQDMDVVIFVGMIAIIALTAREVLRRFNQTEQTFLVVASGMTIFLSVVAPLQYWGITRYMMLCPLAFLGMGVMARRHTALFVLWLVLCALFYWHVELCGYITQGNPMLCPCLGRMEFGMPFGS